jgi:hypothetical protein
MGVHGTMTGGQARVLAKGGWPVARVATLLVVLQAIALCACSSFGEKKKIDENAYPADYKVRIREWLALQVTDPKSIRDAYIAEPALKARGAVTRYIVCLKFDSKDERGQYQGNKEFAAFYYAGEITQIAEATRETCENALYRPYPELEKF